MADHAGLLALIRISQAELPEQTPARLAELARDHYAWHQWRDIHAELDLGGETTLLRITARPPLPLLPPESVAYAPNATPLRFSQALDQVFTPWLLSPSRVLVDTGAKRLFFKEHDQRISSFPVAVGKPGRNTPAGNYTVESVTRDPVWYPPRSLRSHYASIGKSLPTQVPPGPANPLGRYFIKLQKGLGIHGTNQPNSIGQAASWGCIRMREEDVRQLAGALGPGDQVTIIQRAAQLEHAIHTDI